MAREELSINVTAKDDASKVLEGVAKKAEALEDVKVKVGADTDQAERDITGLMQKVDKLGAGDAANLLLTTNASQITTEIADLVIKLDTLDASDPTVDVTVANIGQLQGDLDAIAAKAQEINSTPIQLDTSGAVSNIDNIGRSADSSKSVLANMVGNATQDLGALAGVAGSAGVAVGQMGEYMADALGSGEKFGSVLKNFAGVAGPVAAIGVALQIVSSHMKAVAETKAFNADRVDAFKSALDDLKLSAQELQEILAGEEETGIFVRISDESKNVDQSIQQTMGTFEAFNAEVARGKPAADEYAAGLLASAEAAGVSGQKLVGLKLAIEDATDGTLSGVSATSARIAGFEAEINTLTALGSATSGVAQGTEDAAFKSQFYGEVTEDNTAAIDANNKKLDEHRAKLREQADTYQLAAAGLAQAIDDADAFAAALDRVNEASGLDKSQMMLDTVDSFDAMKEAIEGTKDVAVDWSKVDLTPDSIEELKGIPDELAAVTDGISGMRDSIQTELAAAFETGGIDAYTEKAEFFRSQVLDQFPASFEAMGASAGDAQAQAAALAAELGLMPEDIQIMIELTREEEARAALDVFSSVIGQMPTEVQVAINTAIAQGDIEGALTILNEQLINRGYDPIVLPVDADIAAAEGKVDQVITFADGSTGVVTIDGNPDPATGKVGGVVTFIDGSTGTVTIEGDPDPATGKVDGVITYADGSTGTVVVDADTGAAEGEIANLTKTRNMTVNVHYRGIGAPPTGGQGISPMPDMAMATTATTATVYAVPAPAAAMPPIYINMPAPQPTNVTVQAGVIGNRFDVDRTVTRALRRHQRLNGVRA